MVPTDQTMIGVDTLEEAENVAALLLNDPLLKRYGQV